MHFPADKISVWAWLPYFAAVFLFSSALSAQSVRWEPAEGNTSSMLNLVFENCEPDGEPSLPVIPGVTFTRTGRSDNMSIINSQITRSVTLSYIIRGPQNPPIQIPAFGAKTNKGTLRVAPFNVAAPAAPIDSVASARLVPARQGVWAGEVFPLSYEISVARRANPQVSPGFDWNPAPLVVEDWSKPEGNEIVVNGERRVRFVFNTRAVAKVPNRVKLEAATHLISIQVGTIGFGLFSQPRMEPVSVTSDQPVIEVRPLPSGAPPAFSGAVGQFKLTSKVVPEKAAVGEPVTWTLELSGLGNWPEIDSLPSRNVSNDFQVVQPKAKRSVAEGKLFDATLTEDVVLIPSKPGTYMLGPITFAYFDPKSGTYQTIITPRSTLTISTPSAPQFVSPPQPAPSSSAPDAGPLAPAPAAATRKTLVPPVAPSGIPRDPLPGSGSASIPMPNRTLVAAIVAPFAGLLVFWGLLALRRAQETDPLRPRREARARLSETLTRLSQATDAERSALLLAWQRDTAILWPLAHAAPPATALGSAEWSTLWSEADRALYGPRASLPSDWVARAQAALAAKTVPRFRARRLFLPQNLMPFAAALALGLFAASAWLQAADTSSPAAPGDGLAAYRKGDFPAAEKAWRRMVEQVPTDWIARHNLSLALEQQEHAGEAAAQAAAAFVQHPTDPAVRWHFAHTADKLGAVPGPLAKFAAGSALQSVAQMASPAHWQWVFIIGAWGAATAFGVLLVRAYRSQPVWLKWGAVALLACSVAQAGLAGSALAAYGLSANVDAVIVARAGTLRSIPTEADTTQKVTSLAAGTLALVDKSFLGWRRLAFENGQTGWVRKEDLVPIWK